MIGRYCARCRATLVRETQDEIIVMRVCTLLRTAAWVLSTTFSAQAYAATPSGIGSLIEQIVGAAGHVNYTGVATYEYAGRRSIIRLSSRMHEGLRQRQVVYLDGAQRKVSRYTNAINCLAAENLAPLIGNFISVRGAHRDLYEHYSVVVDNPARVVGRNVDVLRIIPVDTYRYGYSVALDRDTGLVLRSSVVNAQGQVLERFQFIELMLDPAQSADRDIIAPDAGNEHCEDGGAGKALDGPGWFPEWLPPGFMLRGSDMARSDGVSSYMYSDGIAAISVFIEPTGADAPPSFDANLGATAVVHQQARLGADNYSVSVVGEIPRAAAKKIANQVVYLVERQLPR